MASHVTTTRKNVRTRRSSKRGLFTIEYSTIVRSLVLVTGVIPLILNLQNLFKYYAVLVPDYTALMEPASASRSLATRKRKSSPVDQLFQQYQQWHSHETLQKEFETLQGRLSPERKFGIAYYACPIQAGNRMGHFVEAMFWSIITNRTLLWKYYDYSDCAFFHQELKRPPVRYCRSMGKKEDCDAVLRRAEFLPSFVEWQHRLDDLPNATWLPPCTIFSGPRREQCKNIYIDNLNDTVVAYPQAFMDTMYNMQMDQRFHLKRMLQFDDAKERARQLLSVPPGYLCGFLLYAAFQIQPAFTVFPRLPSKEDRKSTIPTPTTTTTLPNCTTKLTDLLERLVPEPTRQGVTVIVHSRHIHDTNNGSNITKEMKCLQKVLTPVQNATQHNEHPHCQIILLSDREATLNHTSRYIQETYPMCDAFSAPHEMKRSFLKEHGPFAGGGFYQDVSLVANQLRFVPTTDTIFVAADRSSNRLVEAAIWNELYQQEQHNQEDDDKIPRLSRCLLENALERS